MNRHYSTPAFFRQVPNPLLGRYFGAKGLFSDLDFTSMKETKPDELLSAWRGLTDDQRAVLEAEFREIFELSGEKGTHAILDEAFWHLREEAAAQDEFAEKLAGLGSHAERAMVAFLDHAEYWKGATRFHHADMLPYWRKRKNLPRQSAAVDDASLDELADLIQKYFHLTEGRGSHCVVEPFRRGDRDYYFAYPEDYAQESVEWVDGVFARRPHTPAFEVVYVYSQAEGSLDLNFRGAAKATEPLQGMFVNAILKLPELPPDPKDTRVYDLNPLRSRGFDFTYDPGSGIQDVVVNKLRLSSKAKRGDRITLEADAHRNRLAIYDLLDSLSSSLPLHLFNVTQVELSATVVADTKKGSKRFRIRLTHPNSCSLKYDEVDLKLREMLSASGIEPLEPEAEGESDGPSEAATP